jgi:hypothetical protein
MADQTELAGMCCAILGIFDCGVGLVCRPVTCCVLGEVECRR